MSLQVRCDVVWGSWCNNAKSPRTNIGAVLCVLYTVVQQTRAASFTFWCPDQWTW